MQLDFWFGVVILIALVLAYQVGVFVTRWRLGGMERTVRKDAVRRSRAALTGQVSEQLAPFLPGFEYKPTELRFIGKPVDYIVFEGLDDRTVERVVFLEVKSGGGALSETEKSLRQAIESGRVAFEIYRVPKDYTRARTS
jgi:predicted Holliday junction resolvase-like endonuclease